MPTVHGMTVQVLVGSSALASAEVEVYDFQRPTALGREKMRSLNMAFEGFARQWATQLTAMTHVVAHVESESVDVERYGEFADGLPEFTAMVLLKVTDVASQAVLQVAPDVALAWVGRMLGGNGTLAAPSRILTLIETSIVGRLIDYVIEDLSYSLGTLLGGSLSVDNIQYSSQMAQAATAGKYYLVARFAVTIGDATAPASIALPLDALSDDDGQGTNHGGSASPEHDRVQLDAVPVSLSLQLANSLVSPAEILGLAEGDLLRLPHPAHRPLNVSVDGHTVATAAVGASGSRLACVIVSLEE
jgi:flagellar motor switch protein FliM